MKTFSPKFLSVLTMLSLTSIVLCTIDESGDDKKATIQIGKKLSTLDDVRLGDYAIRTDNPVYSTAQEELRNLLELLLVVKEQSVTQEMSLKELISFARNKVPALNKQAKANDVLWNAEDQKALDEEIEKNYNALMKLDLPTEKRAFIEYIHAQYLFTNKKLGEGLNVLSSIVKEYSGTRYEVRAKSEKVFRLFLQKTYNKSLAEANALIENHPDTREKQDAVYFKARNEYELKKYNESVKDFDIVITDYPTNKWIESAKYFRARSNYMLNKNQVALQQLNDFIKEYPRSYYIESAKYFCAKMNSLLDNNESAIEQLEAFIKEYPKSTYKDDARELVATIYAKQQNFEKAVETFELYKKENPSVLDQMAADKKILSYADALRLKLRSKSEFEQRIYYDSIVTNYPKKIENYIVFNSGDNKVVAQAYYELGNYYLNQGHDVDKSIYYLRELDTKQYTTTAASNDDDKTGCDSCNYGLISRDNLLMTLAIAYIKKGWFAESEKIKEMFNEKKLYVHYFLIVFQEAARTKSMKQWIQAEQKYWEIYNDSRAPNFIRALSLFSIGNIYQISHIKNHKNAIEIFNKVVAEFPREGIAKTAQKIISKNEKN